MNTDNSKYSFSSFLPLIIIFSLILIFSITRQFFLNQFDLHKFMTDFMGSFFIVFGTFKIINLKNFAQAYSTYDLLAQKSKFYAYVYPFIELFLGISYLVQWNLKIINSITIFVMLISAIGVFNELRKGQHITCACLGLVFKIPMTYVTLFEDLLMALMALIMLLF